MLEINCFKLNYFKSMYFILAIASFGLAMVFMSRLSQVLESRSANWMQKLVIALPLMNFLFLMAQAVLEDLCPWNEES